MKNIKKVINQFSKTVKKHRFKIPTVFFFASLIFFFAISYKLFFSTKTTPSNMKQVPTSVSYPYTEERRKWDEETKARNAASAAIAEAPYIFRPADLPQLLERYHTTLNDLTTSSSSFEPVECLVSSYNYEELYTIDINVGKISDEKVLAYAGKISNYEFSDELVTYLSDGSVKIYNKGEKSKHTVKFDGICKLDNIYFFVFNSYGEKTHIGGGGSAPSHLAFSDSLGNLTIIERISRNSKYIELLQTADSSLTTTNDIAYYGCRRIYAANDQEIIYHCGGGDGPGSAGGLFLLNLSSKTPVEKVFCEYSSSLKYKTRCFDSNGQIYYQELN